MATERLEAELVAHAAWEAAGMARMLAVLAEFDRRQAWASWECRSAQHWLSWKCGLGYTAATERLRVARVLPRLPLISAALVGGLLSWSKVRELTRVATADNEGDLVNVAVHGTAAQVSHLVGTMRRVTRDQAITQLIERSFRWATEPDGSVTITVRLPADRAMPVIRTVEAATTTEKGVPRSQSAADALVDLVCGDRGTPGASWSSTSAGQALVSRTDHPSPMRSPTVWPATVRSRPLSIPPRGQWSWIVAEHRPAGNDDGCRATTRPVNSLAATMPAPSMPTTSWNTHAGAEPGCRI